ncbi:MAG: YxeA family protein [Oscillospiraceae bacterium]|jgi:uncharacterized protein (TIGR01655 family)|nr:YxeA family protein [Oscillospiraceae bacterium]
MKRKITIGIAIVLAIGLVAMAVVWLLKYSTDRYASSDYYAMVPLNYNVTPEMIYSDNGKELGPGKVYTLTIYNEQGEAREVSFTVFAPNGGKLAGEQELPKPGEYLLVKASKQLVNRWSVVDKSTIPENVLKSLA